VTNQFLALQFGEHSKWFFDRALRWLQDCTNPEVDDIEPIDTEISKIVMNAVNQRLT